MSSISTSTRWAASAGELVLERRDDGHFYADVEVNGVPISMLVDTGASSVALSADDARRAGIATTIGMNEVSGEGVCLHDCIDGTACPGTGEYVCDQEAFFCDPDGVAG